MSMLKRACAFLMTLALLMTGLSLMAFAAEAQTEGTGETTGSHTGSQSFRTGWRVNPLYEDLIDLSAEPEPFTGYYASGQSENEYLSEAEAAAELREKLEARAETVWLCVEAPASTLRDFNAFLDSLFAAATAHTGEPTEGDYILYHLSGYYCSYGYSTTGDVTRYNLTITVFYLSSAEEEAQMETAAANLLTELALDGKSDYEKIRAIYDYMCANIEYDYDNLNDYTYMRKYSAYAALVNKKAVCQGYANLFYRLALAAGVDARIISGIGNGGPHAWNIVELNGLYYNLDSTWDSQRPYYNWFLCCEEDFSDHVRDVQYDTETFHTDYPMATRNYDPDDLEAPSVPETPDTPDAPEEQIATTSMYRLYNPHSGEHFYTGSLEERDMLVTAGWIYEGVAWNAPVSTGDPVYRLYNPYSGDHHYTMSIEEKDMLVAAGWKYEGVAWNSATPNNLPLYRLYNPNADCGSHHYTGSTEERDFLVSVGWIYEGIGWFGMLK